MILEVSFRRVFSLLGLAGLLLMAGCANPLTRVSALEQYSHRSDSTLTSLSGELDRANNKISKLEDELGDANAELDSLKSMLNANSREAYLRVVVPVLNIRTSPTASYNNIIAKAETGAYLRKLETVSEDGKWCKVEFLVDDYPFIGYAYNDAEYLKEEVYDPITFSNVYRRNLISYEWKTEAALEMKSNRFRTVGVFVKGNNDGQRERFLSDLSKALRDHKIYVKPLTRYSIAKIDTFCTEESIEGVMLVEFVTNENASHYIEVKLYDRNSVILYAASVPLQPVDLTKL